MYIKKAPYHITNVFTFSYCKHCLEYGFKVPLRNRIYLNQPVPVDHENWKQCHECGLIVAVHELEKEASVTDVVDTVESPFEISIDFLGVDSRSAKKRKRLKDSK